MVLEGDQRTSVKDSSDDSVCHGCEGLEELYDVDMVRFDVHIDGPPKVDDRARLFQNIARKFRDKVCRDRKYTINDQNRMRALKNCLLEVIARSEGLREECTRQAAQISYLGGHNEELTERVSSVTSSYVQACFDRDINGQHALKWKRAAIGLLCLCCLLIGVVTYLLLRK